MTDRTQRQAAEQHAPAEAVQSGFQLYQQGRLSEAASLIINALTVDPAYFDAIHLLGLVRFAQGDLNAALDLIDRALRVNGASAEALTNRASILVNLGRLEEAVISCDRAIAINPRDTNAHNNRGTALQRLGRFRDALASYHKALAIQPSPGTLANHAGALIRLGRLEEALVSCDQALSINPGNANAWTNRGIALLRLRRLDEALASSERALAIDSSIDDAWNCHGSALRAVGRLEEALRSYERAIGLNPRLDDAWAFRGDALAGLCRFDEALASCEKALAINRDNSGAHFAIGTIKLLSGDFSGWKQYESRFELADGPGLRSAAPQWRGETSLSGKTILLYAEQGLGDSILAMRYVPHVAKQAASVILGLQPPLLPIVPRLPDNVTTIWNETVPIDVECPLLSLPLAFGTTLATIPKVPYIHASDERTARWQERLPRHHRRRVGLVWAGNAKNDDDQNRSTTLARLLPLLDVPSTSFISLQRDLRPGDEALLTAHPQITHVGNALADFADTAAIISLLDLVITVDTSVAHLAGAMGKPVWIMLTFKPFFCWLLEREDSPWYPTARLFRQPSPGAWDVVATKVAAELATLSR